MRVYSLWVYTAKCIVGVYCDWVCNASCGCTGIVGIYSDWVYNAKCIVGTTHMLMTKPIALWVHTASYIVGVSGNHDNSDTRVGLRNIGATILHCSPQKQCAMKFLPKIWACIALTTKFVPPMLTDDQKQNRVVVSQEFPDRANDDNF